MRWFNDLPEACGSPMRVGTLGVIVLVMGGVATSNAFASSRGSSARKLCIPKAAGKPVKTPTRRGHCPRKYKLVELGRQGIPGLQGKAGPKGDKGERGEAAGFEALQFFATGGGVITGGQVVSVPAGSYGPTKIAPENTISFGPQPFAAHAVVAEVFVAGKESLGEAT